MRVFTIKASRKLVFGVLMGVTALFVCAVVLISSTTSSAVISQIENINASDESERIAFLAQFGWTVQEDPYEVRELIIPEEFNDVYTNYNEIQKEQGFDLEQYQGVRVKRWTYVVTNYPGYESTEVIHANLLVLDGKVIGGDIGSVELDGFMHGFKGTGVSAAEEAVTEETATEKTTTEE